MVYHNILIKLELCGIRGIANTCNVNWCRYLKTRSQYVCLNETISEYLKVTGVYACMHNNSNN